MTQEKWWLYAVSKGNYPQNITRALEKRQNWTALETSPVETLQQVDFFWKQTNLLPEGQTYLRKREKPLVFNHFERHHFMT